MEKAAPLTVDFKVGDTVQITAGPLEGFMGLVEEIDTHEAGFVTGRLSNNTVVHFAGDASLIGKIVDVSLDEAKGFYYMGSLVK